MNGWVCVCVCDDRKESNHPRLSTICLDCWLGVFVIMSMIRINDFSPRHTHTHNMSQIHHNSIDLDACKIQKEREIKRPKQKKLKWVVIECHECMANFRLNEMLTQ